MATSGISNRGNNGHTPTLDALRQTASKHLSFVRCCLVIQSGIALRPQQAGLQAFSRQWRSTAGHACSWALRCQVLAPMPILGEIVELSGEGCRDTRQCYAVAEGLGRQHIVTVWKN
eukprot:5998983-Amphidinium_carterae.1